eukprot:182839-Pyramimonas_sp.AAC.1
MFNHACQVATLKFEIEVLRSSTKAEIEDLKASNRQLEQAKASSADEVEAVVKEVGRDRPISRRKRGYILMMDQSELSGSSRQLRPCCIVKPLTACKHPWPALHWYEQRNKQNKNAIVSVEARSAHSG